MKSELLNNYIKDEGEYTFNYYFPIIIDLESLKKEYKNFKSDYKTIISIVMPKFIETINNNPLLFDSDINLDIKLFDENTQLYHMTNCGFGYFEPFEEGFIDNTDDTNTFLKFVHSILACTDLKEYDDVLRKELKFRNFPKIEGIRQLEELCMVTYKDGVCSLITDSDTDKYSLIDKMIKSNKKYLCLSVIYFNQIDNDCLENKD